MGQESVLVALISVIGSGTLVPLIWGALGRWRRQHQPETRRRETAREEQRYAEAAGAAVDAVRGVLAELRLARDADKQLLAVQQGELVQLHKRERELIERVDGLRRECSECQTREATLRTLLGET